MSTYDIFISYRRAGSEDFARAVYQELIHRKYKVFLDRQNLLAGIYEKQIHSVIEQVRDVIIILPQNALDRCTEENDLFRKEIAHAISADKNIILIMRQGFEFPNIETLPEEIRSITKFEAIKETPDHFDDVMVRLLALLENSAAGIKKRKKQLHLALTAIVSVILVIGAICFSSVFLKNDISDFEIPEPSWNYQYVGAKAEPIIDSGHICEITAGMDMKEVCDLLETSLSFQDIAVKEYVSFFWELTGDIKSFEFEGETATLGMDDGTGQKYNALLVFRISYGKVVYMKYVFGSDDINAIDRTAEALYKKLDNGHGIDGEHIYKISNHYQLNGTVGFGRMKNQNEKNCFYYILSADADKMPVEEKSFNFKIDDYENITLSDFYQDEISTSCIITDVQSKIIDNRIELTIKGKKTFDKYGEKHSANVGFTAKLKDSEGNTVATTNVYSPDICVGEIFKTNAVFYASSLDSNEIYTIQFEDDAG